MAPIVHRVKRELVALLRQAHERQQDIELGAPQPIRVISVTCDDKIENLVLIRRAQSAAR